MKISSLSQIPHSTWLKSSLERQSIKKDKYLKNCYFPNIKEFSSFKYHIVLQSIFLGFSLSRSRYKNIRIVNVNLDYSLIDVLQAHEMDSTALKIKNQQLFSKPPSLSTMSDKSGY